MARARGAVEAQEWQVHGCRGGAGMEGREYRGGAGMGRARVDVKAIPSSDIHIGYPHYPQAYPQENR